MSSDGFELGKFYEYAPLAIDLNCPVQECDEVTWVKVKHVAKEDGLHVLLQETYEPAIMHVESHGPPWDDIEHRIRLYDHFYESVPEDDRLVPWSEAERRFYAEVEVTV